MNNRIISSDKKFIAQIIALYVYLLILKPRIENEGRKL